VNDLLEYSRVDSQPRPFQTVNLNGVVERALANIHSAITDTKAEITHDGLPTVKGDESQLIQLFQNLISNGIKFHVHPPPKVHLSARKEQDHWMLCVKDEGIGIEPKSCERVFDFFTRLNDRELFPGTGIGLPICRRVVERHGGRIWVESSLGNGCEFFFTLPAEDASDDPVV
jgi:light-regulated signal transduction histidine kinase (bacteriophytochrome)